MIQPIDRIYKFCAYQDRSVYETRLKIRSLKNPEINENQLIERLIADKFLDDIRFTENFIQGKMNAKGWGIAKIKQGLFQKGVPELIIKEALQEIDETKYIDNLRKELVKWKKVNDLNPQTKPKLIRFLFSKGYSYDQIINEIE
ncbi:MAG TPA: regulatory protein RecX [Bacteroidales bacterium]|jgi:regulatory protein|nr:regulatory protein RecX [Bacteroidales bacterium]